MLDKIGLLDVDPASEGFDVLKASVDNLTSQFESRLSDMSDRWEIGGLVAKVCQLKDMDDSVHRLLRVMALMKTTDPGPSVIWPAVDRATLLSLQSIAENDDESFEGFLKIFPSIAAGRRTHPDFDKETIHSDISRAIQMARTKSGAVQKGAIAFLAENLNKDLSAIVALLLCPVTGKYPKAGLRIWFTERLTSSNLAKPCPSSFQSSHTTPTILPRCAQRRWILCEM